MLIPTATKFTMNGIRTRYVLKTLLHTHFFGHHLVRVLLHQGVRPAAPNLRAKQSFAVAVCQERKNFGNIRTHEITNLVVRRGTVDIAS